MFRIALSKVRPRANTLNNLGIALKKQGRLEEARKCFGDALRENPNLVEARENLKRLAD